jgi:selenide,water dikinase
MPLEELSQVLRLLPSVTDPNVLVGTNTADDAGVYRLTDDLALVQTVDVFPPVIDDAFDYGYIVGANSCSDCWAMGAKAICVMNVIGFPISKLDGEVLANILQGGAQAMVDSGVAIVGGHTWTAETIIYGMSVSGTVHPDRIVQVGGARPGDRLIITKPLGTGTITNAVKPGLAAPDVLAAAVASMKKLNKRASELMLKFGVTACTDVTGFGFVGHLLNIVKNSAMSVEVETARVPLLPGALQLSKDGLSSGMCFKNYRYMKADTDIAESVPMELSDLLFDSETSGGLLIAVPDGAAQELLAALSESCHECAMIGRFSEPVTSPRVVLV